MAFARLPSTPGTASRARIASTVPSQCLVSLSMLSPLTPLLASFGSSRSICLRSASSSSIVLCNSSCFSSGLWACLLAADDDDDDDDDDCRPRAVKLTTYPPTRDHEGLSGGRTPVRKLSSRSLREVQQRVPASPGRERAAKSPGRTGLLHAASTSTRRRLRGSLRPLPSSPSEVPLRSLRHLPTATSTSRTARAAPSAISRPRIALSPVGALASTAIPCACSTWPRLPRSPGELPRPLISCTLVAPEAADDDEVDFSVFS